jgi:hypothetical protein
VEGESYGRGESQEMVHSLAARCEELEARLSQAEAEAVGKYV